MAYINGLTAEQRAYAEKESDMKYHSGFLFWAPPATLSCNLNLY